MDEAGILDQFHRPESGGLEHVTLFAPLDRAFYRTAKIIGYNGTYNKKKVLEHLVDKIRTYAEENESISPNEALKNILLYHIGVKGLRVKKLRRRGRIATKYDRVKLRVRRANFGRGRAKLVDKSSRFPLISGRKNIKTLNGYIHVVKDYMLMPYGNLEGVLLQQQSEPLVETGEGICSSNISRVPAGEAQMIDVVSIFG